MLWRAALACELQFGIFLGNTAVQAAVTYGSPIYRAHQYGSDFAGTNDTLFQARMGVGLLSIFGLLALGLASIGLYALREP
jgi:hypothetical protein